MGGACSDPSLQYRNNGVLFDSVKQSVVPSLVASPGLVSGSAFGTPTAYGIEEIQTGTHDIQPMVNTAITQIVEQDIFVDPAEAIHVPRLNALEAVEIANRSRVNLIGTVRQVDSTGQVFLEHQTLRTQVQPPSVYVPPSMPPQPSVAQFQTQTQSTFIPARPSLIQTSYVQPRASLVAVAAPALVAQQTVQQVSAAPQQPGLPFEGNLVASKIDIYGHRTWQDGNVIVQTNNGAQAYQQLDVYGNRRRDFVFQT